MTDTADTGHYYSYQEAAAWLQERGIRYTAYWLQRHISELPHRKFPGGRTSRVYFADEDLAAIVAMFEQPAPVKKPGSLQGVTRRRSA